MSEHVSRAEFNELKGQLDLVCQHLGLDFGGIVTEGTGRRRAENAVLPEFKGFEQDEQEERFNLGSYEPVVQQEESEDEDEGWESINDDELEHGFSDDETDESESVEDTEEDESEDAVWDEPTVEVNEYNVQDETEEETKEEAPVKPAPATGGIPTSLNFHPVVKDEDAFDYAEDAEESEEDTQESHPYDETPEYEAVEDSSVTPDILDRIFEDANALTAHDIAAKQFTTIKKTLFTSPYEEDAVDEVLDEYLELLQSRDVSESKYADALLKLKEVKFPEDADGYKKAEVDAFLSEIGNELQRRINIFS